MTDQLRTDTQLLRAFVAENDQSAFAEIVDRHGPMVGRVCFRIIGDAAEAEDAAQAVFLVLVKKAASLRRKSALGSWLHGVARTISLQAVRGRARRKQREEAYAMTEETARHEVRAEAESIQADIVAALDGELAGLSERQRQAIVLRHLEGRSPAECAAITGCSETALRRRASDGVAELRRRFTKRGLALSAGALIATLDCEAQAAIIPTLLPYVTAATKGLVAGATSSAVSTTVGSLVEGGIRMLIWNKVQTVAVSVLVVAALTGAGGVIIAAQKPSLPRDGEQRPVEQKDVLSVTPPTQAEIVNGLRLTLEEAPKPTAEEMAIGSRLSMLHKACMMYEMDHGAYPETLAALYPDYIGNLDAFVRPREQAPASKHEIDRGSSYSLNPRARDERSFLLREKPLDGRQWVWACQKNGVGVRVDKTSLRRFHFVLRWQNHLTQELALSRNYEWDMEGRVYVLDGSGDLQQERPIARSAVPAYRTISIPPQGEATELFSPWLWVVKPEQKGQYVVWVEFTRHHLRGQAEMWAGTVRSNAMVWHVGVPGTMVSEYKTE